jgi:hypothetical protein
MTQEEEKILGGLAQDLKYFEGWEGYEMLKKAMISFKKALYESKINRIVEESKAKDDQR